MVKEAAGGSGLFVGAPYAGLGLANFGKVAKNVFRFITSTPAQICPKETSALSVRRPQRRALPARQPQIVQRHMFFLLDLVPRRWASAELTLHEEGSMFGSAIASRHDRLCIYLLPLRLEELQDNTRINFS